LDTKDDCKTFVQNYTRNDEIVNHYILDDRVHTCFSFDPRNPDRNPLFAFLDESVQNENQKRRLQTESDRKYPSLMDKTVNGRPVTCSMLVSYCF
jgi:hypothetical protein